MMRKAIIFLAIIGFAVPVEAQRTLTLDSCRALALRNNKQLGISRVKQDMARNVRKAAHTKYLPHVDGVGSYTLSSKEISLLSDSEKKTLNNIGTTVGGTLQTNLTSAIEELAKSGLITSQQASALGQTLQQSGATFSSALNEVGKKICDDFRSNTRNVFVGSVMFTQPVYMGGKIVAMNRLAEYGEEFEANNTEVKRQSTLYNTDQAYWMVVSLKHKRKLAQSYLDLVKKLDKDVCKMIKEGVTTKSEGLKVGVKVNEAEMALTQAEDGLSLAKMFLCQLCGLPISDDITLADEDKENLSEADVNLERGEIQMAFDNRPELKMLQNMVEMSQQTVKIVRSDYLPSVALTGGYMISNPNVYNSFENKFSGIWSVGILVRVPILNWGEGSYKVKAAKGNETIAMMEFYDAREKIELQVNQVSFKVREANKRLIMACSNTRNADENLRCATLGFKEGVIESTTVLEAQTAWVQAQSQKIDAEIEVKLAHVDLQKAMGILK